MSAVTANSILTSGDIIKCEITSNRDPSKKMDISAGIVMLIIMRVFLTVQLGLP